MRSAEILADRYVEAACESGAFGNLPGEGRPQPHRMFSGSWDPGLQLLKNAGCCQSSSSLGAQSAIGGRRGPCSSESATQARIAPGRGEAVSPSPPGRSPGINRRIDQHNLRAPHRAWQLLRLLLGREPEGGLGRGRGYALRAVKAQDNPQGECEQACEA